MEINKLIDALRVCADENIICTACEQYISMKEAGGTVDCVDDLLVKAASALEAQQKRIAELEAERRWIPVGERLPEPEKRVLILTKAEGWNSKEYREIMCGFYEDGNVWCEDSKVCWDYEMKREENYDESRDDYRVPEGWFEELLNQHIANVELDTDNAGVVQWVLSHTPTVDAVEVVHGEWEITEDDYFDLVEMKCSVCGESYGFEDYEDCIPKIITTALTAVQRWIW